MNRRAERGAPSRAAGRRGTHLPCAMNGYAARLIVMVKEPIAGSVKTRLARDIGAAAAVRFYRHATAALLARVGCSRRWRTVLAVSPDTGRASRVWPAQIMRIAQGRGDLGARMQRLFDRSWRGPLVIVGSDIPGIAPAHIATAFRALRDNDAVVGPAPDGGYWLVGLRRRPRVERPFAGVRWSSRETLADTLANLKGRRAARIANLADVDDQGDLERQSALIGRHVLPLSARVPAVAPR